MGFFSKLWKHTATGSKQPESAGGAQHAVLIYAKLADDGFGTPEDRARCFKLEDRLEAAIEQAAAGEFDGNEFGGGFFTAFTYGSDADRLFAAMQDVLRAWPMPPGSYVIMRYGEPGAREVRVELAEPG